MNAEEKALTVKVAGEIVGSFEYVRSSALIGSGSYLAEPVDIDVAILIEDGINVFEWESRYCQNWERCSDYDKVENSAKWTSVRKGLINLMITNSQKFFDDYKTATEVCKALKLTDKAQRIAVCQIVRDGKQATEVVL